MFDSSEDGRRPCSDRRRRRAMGTARSRSRDAPHPSAIYRHHGIGVYGALPERRSGLQDATRLADNAVEVLRECRAGFGRSTPHGFVFRLLVQSPNRGRSPGPCVPLRSGRWTPNSTRSLVYPSGTRRPRGCSPLHGCHRHERLDLRWGTQATAAGSHRQQAWSTPESRH